MALANSIKNSAIMIAQDFFSFDLTNFSGLSFKIFVQKVFHTNFTYETNAHGLFFGGNIKTFIRSEGLNFRFS